MPEGLVNAAGQPIDPAPAGESAFAAAMAAPPALDVPEPPDRPVVGEKPARRGRPPKADRTAKPAKAEPAPPDPKVDYTGQAVKLVGSTWTVMASIPPTQGFALIVRHQADALSAALAEGARHNSTIRRWVGNGGNAGWQVQLAACGVSMAMQGLQLARDPDLRAQCAAATREQLAELAGSAVKDAAGGSPDQPQ